MGRSWACYFQRVSKAGGQRMRRKHQLIWISVLSLALAGCSGVKDAADGSIQAVSVVVSPATAKISNFTTQNFTATVTGSSNTAVNWQVNGVTGGSQSSGFISSAGLYVAPGGVPTTSDSSGGVNVTNVMITATSQANPSAIGTATVTLAPQNENAQAGAVKLGTSGGNVNDVSGQFCCSGTL